MTRKLIRTRDDIPKHFESAAEEAAFWQSHELADEFIEAHIRPRGQSASAVLQSLRDQRAAEEATRLPPIPASSSSRQRVRKE
jgi:hypothetical protein